MNIDQYSIIHPFIFD